MKTNQRTILSILFFFAMMAGNDFVHGQVIAGITPSSAYAVNPNLNLSVVTIDDDTTGTLDLNCDNIPDLAIQLIKGFTAVDGASSVYLYILNTDYSICADTISGMISLVKYYNDGDVIHCNGGFSWGTDTIYRLGDYGCMACQGPWTISNKYFAYNDGTSIGWMKVSFDLVDNGGTTVGVTCSMTEFISYCNPNSIDENSIDNELQIGPNPTADGKINLQYKGKISEVEVYNSIGQKVDFTLDETELILPDVKGVYVVKVKNSMGRSFSKSVVRN